MNRIIAMAAVCCLPIAGCGDSASSDPPITEAQPEAGLLDGQVNALDRAESVEELNRKKKSGVDDALRKAEEGVTP